MIANNYAAMKRVQEFARKELTLDLVFELHEEITEETLDEPDAAGRFRRSDEEVLVTSADGDVLHRPPPASELKARFEEFRAFANEASPDYYLHPVVRSILIHFWLAYDHPFVDGNGRVARALFYWSMLRHGYWLAEFLSISSILHDAPSKYARSFLYAETDDNDATYFVVYQLEVLERSIRELRDHLARKMRAARGLQHRLREIDLNHRQLALLTHALRHPDGEYTIQSHKNSHRIVYQTARTDLLDLSDRRLLVRVRRGRRFVFRVPGDLEERLTELSRRS